MTTELGDMVFLLILLHREGIRAVVTIFLPAERLWGQTTELLIMNPCRADSSLVLARADSMHSRSGGLNPMLRCIHPVRLWDFSHQQALGLKVLEVLVFRFQSIRAYGTNESQYQPIVPGILHKDFCCISLSKRLYLWQQGRRRQDWLMLA